MRDPSKPPDDNQRTKHNWDRLPAELKGLRRWLTWCLQSRDGGKPTKVPDCSTKDRSRFRSFEDVKDTPSSAEGGIGLAFTGGVDLPAGEHEEPIRLLAFDIDGCVDEDGVADWAVALIRSLDCSYTEVSPSGHGLRTFVGVLNPPDSVPIIKVPSQSRGGKVPQIQVFGCGPAGYVTVTAQHLEGSDLEIRTVVDLDWLFTTYALQVEKERADHVPEGHGPTPTLDDIERALSARAQTLCAGDWEKLGLPSASEGWFSLSLMVLEAARGHVHAATAFLLGRTQYGSGNVDSRDPGKYTREDWVFADLCRVASKHSTKADVFGEFDADAWVPPKTAPLAPIKGRLLQLQDFEARAKNVRWLYRGFLPERGLAQIFGPPSSGKTAVAVSLAVHAATGHDWLGFKLAREGWVFYIAGEGASGLAGRMRVALQQLDPTITTGEVRMHVSTTAGDFDDAEDRRRWASEIIDVSRERRSPPVLIVLDTQSRNFGAGDENSTQDMRQFIAEVDRLSEQTGALVLLVHHSGFTNRERGRGSSAMIGALDVAIEAFRGEGSNIVNLETKKAKDWDAPPIVSGTLVGIECGTDDQGEPVTAVCFSTAPVVPEDVFEQAPQDEATMAWLRSYLRHNEAVPLPRRALAAQHGVTEKAVRVAIEWMVSAGLVTKSGTTRNTTYTLTDEGVRILKPAPGSENGPIGPTPGAQ